MSRRLLLADSYQAPAVGGASDNFNRADSGTLGTSSSGHVWTNHGTPTFGIVSNAAHPPAGVSDYNIASLDGGLVNCTVQCTITAPIGLDFDAGLAGRVVDQNNFIILDVSRSGSDLVTRVFKRVGGSFTGLTTFLNPAPGVAQGTPFVAKLVLSGAGGEAFLNATSIGTFSGLDAVLQTPTRNGIVTSLSDTTAVFEDFSIT
jgi:hypothetical protein